MSRKKLGFEQWLILGGFFIAVLAGLAALVGYKFDLGGIISVAALELILGLIYGFTQKFDVKSALAMLLLFAIVTAGLVSSLPMFGSALNIFLTNLEALIVGWAIIPALKQLFGKQMKF